MRTHGTVGTLDLYKSFTCPTRPHHSKQNKKCPIKAFYIKQIGQVGRVGRLIYVEVQNVPTCPFHDIES